MALSGIEMTAQPADVLYNNENAFVLDFSPSFVPLQVEPKM